MKLQVNVRCEKRESLDVYHRVIEIEKSNVDLND